jgi:hypothetical protein
VSRYSGKQFKGAAKQARERKRREAEERNAATPIHRTRRYREGNPEERLLMDIFGEAPLEAS